MSVLNKKEFNTLNKIIQDSNSMFPVSKGIVVSLCETIEALQSKMECHMETILQLEERLQRSPFGDDKIDELEEACDNLRFQNDELRKIIETYERDWKFLNEEVQELRDKLSIPKFNPSVYEKIYNQDGDDMLRARASMKQLKPIKTVTVPCKYMGRMYKSKRIEEE